MRFRTSNRGDVSVIKVAVFGSEGRMGSETCAAVQSADDMELVAALDEDSAGDVTEALSIADVMVDFTVPEAALANIRAAAGAGVHCVVGTTGFPLDELDSITGANILVAPNFALGAVLMMQFAAKAAEVFRAAEIIELHHDGKLDRPSGTAALTARMISESGGFDPAVHSVRLPGLVAHQEVIFGSRGETLSIRHDTVDRSCFMPGVLLAVRAVAKLDRTPVIGLENIL